jgi:hypothetical protein
MSLFYWILLLKLCVACEKEKQNIDCIDSEKIDLNKSCIEIYKPVCGCNQKTYYNSCFAEINGLNSWNEGACK